MPFWLANLCDRVTDCLSGAPPSNCWLMPFAVIGLGLIVCRLRQ